MQPYVRPSVTLHMCYTLRLFTLVRIFQIAVHYIRYVFTGSKNDPIKKRIRYLTFKFKREHYSAVHFSLNSTDICRLANNQKLIHYKPAVKLCVVLWHANCFKMNLIKKPIRPKLHFSFLYSKLYIVTKATIIQFFLLTLPIKTYAHKIQRPGNHPKERIQHSEHSESLKSSKIQFVNIKCHSKY
jgi:hypothetical protein